MRVWCSCGLPRPFNHKRDGKLADLRCDCGLAGQFVREPALPVARHARPAPKIAGNDNPWPSDASGRPRPGFDSGLRQFDDQASMLEATGCPAFFDAACSGRDCMYFRLDDSHGARGQVVSCIAACTWPGTPRKQPRRHGIGWFKPAQHGQGVDARDLEDLRENGGGQ